jgi:plastocyanin
LRFRLAFIVCAVAGLAVAGTAVAAASHHTAAKPKPVTITVVAKEFSFTFSKPSVPAGTTVIFKVVNKGALAHNLVFTSAGRATPLLSPGATKLLTVVFKKAGLYPYICSVDRHAEQGMAGSFLVKKK